MNAATAAATARIGHKALHSAADKIVKEVAAPSAATPSAATATPLLACAAAAAISSAVNVTSSAVNTPVARPNWVRAPLNNPASPVRAGNVKPIISNKPITDVKGPAIIPIPAPNAIAAKPTVLIGPGTALITFNKF